MVLLLISCCFLLTPFLFYFITFLITRVNDFVNCYDEVIFFKLAVRALKIYI
jgi:hypothetical protein